MTEVTRDPAQDRRVAVEHVRAFCPRLIATLVAMARASKGSQDSDGSVNGGPTDVTP